MARLKHNRSLVVASKADVVDAVQAGPEIEAKMHVSQVR